LRPLLEAQTLRAPGERQREAIIAIDLLRHWSEAAGLQLIVDLL
jgi:hypothetical protein